MRIGRIMGVDIHINIFFLLVIGLFFLAGVMAKGLIAFSIVLMHELAHVFVARRFNMSVGEIELLPFGGVARMGDDLTLDPFKEIYVASAGPVCNLVMAVFCIGLKKYGIWNEELCLFFLQYNLLIAAFNLIPALPLDGGRVYRAYLSLRIGIRDATYRAARLGQWWALVIIFFGSLGLAFGFTGLDVLFTGLFLFYASTREKGMAPYLFVRHLIKKKAELTRLGMLPAEWLVVLEDVPLGRVIRLFLPQRFHLVVVFDLHWQRKGIITEAQVVDGLMEHGMGLPVGKLPLQPF